MTDTILRNRRRHKQDTATFAELSPADQARSVNGTARSLEGAMRHRIEKAPAEERAGLAASQVEILERMAERLRAEYA